MTNHTTITNLAKRIIPCLDVKDGKVVKGVRFRDHQVMGDIVPLAQQYSEQGADELVFYDITASSEQRTVTSDWVRQVAKVIDIPFCVAGGIRDLASAESILNNGADKISINSPALEQPEFITELAKRFGSQCVVVGVDSLQQDDDYFVYQYTGDPDKTQATQRRTIDWVKQAQQLGAGEIVLNCMNQDGVRQGYDHEQCQMMREQLTIPLIASGGAGTMDHFKQLFQKSQVDGALAASVFHKGTIDIGQLKQYLAQNNIQMRI